MQRRCAENAFADAVRTQKPQQNAHTRVSCGRNTVSALIQQMKGHRKVDFGVRFLFVFFFRFFFVLHLVCASFRRSVVGSFFAASFSLVILPVAVVLFLCRDVFCSLADMHQHKRMALCKSSSILSSARLLFATKTQNNEAILKATDINYQIGSYRLSHGVVFKVFFSKIIRKPDVCVLPREPQTRAEPQSCT